MATPNITFRTSGPFFQGIAPAVIRAALEDTVGAVAVFGERSVKLQLYGGHGVRTGHYRRSIHGEQTSSLHGRIHDTNVIYGPWLEGVSSRNQTTRFKGYAMFRNAKQQLEREKGNILQSRITKALGRLN